MISVMGDVLGIKKMHRRKLICVELPLIGAEMEEGVLDQVRLLMRRSMMPDVSDNHEISSTF